MHQKLPDGLRTQPAVAAAVAAALDRDPHAPLVGAVELLVHACVRAARLYPEWATVLEGTASGEIDAIAQHIVASNLHILNDASR